MVIIKNKNKTYKLNKIFAVIFLLFKKRYKDVYWILDNWYATKINIG